MIAKLLNVFLYNQEFFRITDLKSSTGRTNEQGLNYIHFFENIHCQKYRLGNKDGEKVVCLQAVA